MTVGMLCIAGSFMALILGRAGQDTIWQLSFWFMGFAIWVELYKMNRKKEKPC